MLQIKLRSELKEYLKLRDYAISTYKFSDIEEYGSYFLMLMGWLSFILLDLNGIKDFFIAIPLSFLLGVILRELRLMNMHPAIMFAWLYDGSIREKTDIIETVIKDLERNKSE